MSIRRVKSKGDFLTNHCGYCTESGTPMVGSKYCTNHCPHFKATFKFLHWKFIICKYID